jgi:hypothetical protein
MPDAAARDDGLVAQPSQVRNSRGGSLCAIMPSRRGLSPGKIGPAGNRGSPTVPRTSRRGPRRQEVPAGGARAGYKGTQPWAGQRVAGA